MTLIYQQTDHKRIAMALSQRMQSWHYWSAKARELLIDTFIEEVPNWCGMSDSNLIAAAQAFVSRHEASMKDRSHPIITRRPAPESGVADCACCGMQIMVNNINRESHCDGCKPARKREAGKCNPRKSWHCATDECDGTMCDENGNH